MMIRNILFLAVMFVITASAAAQIPVKPVTIYFDAGIALTGSDSLKAGWKTGYQLEAGVGIATSRFMEIVLRLAMTRLPIDRSHYILAATGGNFKTLMYGADLKLNIGAPLVPVRPYLLGGLGLATIDIDDPTGIAGISDFQLLNSLSLSEAKTRIYFTFGVGIELRRMFLQWRIVKTSADEITYCHIPISLGLHF